MPPSPPPSSTAQVAGVVCFYMVAALSQTIAVFLFLVADALRLFPDRLSFDLKICKGLVPMAALGILGLSLSNYTLKYVDASFYQVARGLVLPFTVCVSGVVLHSRPSLRILFSCTIVTVGFFAGVFLDGTAVSLVGVGFGVASSTVTATHSVVIKQSLNIVNGSTILLSWYTNLMGIFMLAPLIILGEGTSVIKLLFFDVDEPGVVPGATSPLRTFVVGSLLTGALGFMMSLASLLSIKVTSPITHMVSSAVRGVAASVLGVWLFQEVITGGRAASIAIILAGSVYYTWVKHQETEGAKADAYDHVSLNVLERGQKPHPE